MPSTPGKPLVMKFDSRSVELSWSPPLHSHYSEVQHYTIHILQGEDADWASHQVSSYYCVETAELDFKQEERIGEDD